jgi:hypothetical protein
VADDATPGAPAPRPAWLWPLRLPHGPGVAVLRWADRCAGRIGPGWRWPLAGLGIGAVPLMFDCVTGWPTSRFVTALLLTPLLAAAVARDRQACGLAGVGAAFVAHSLLAILLVGVAPGRMAAVLPGGPGYWDESRAWLVTGESPEYDPAVWVPAHMMIFAAAVALTYLSLGFTTFWQGFYEVDLMNYYVGRLAAESHDPLLALLAGWHPWSVCRGAGYLFLTFEVASWSLQRLSGVPLSTAARRRRWLIGTALLLLDAGLKAALLEPVRATLATNLR